MRPVRERLRPLALAALVLGALGTAALGGTLFVMRDALIDAYSRRDSELAALRWLKYLIPAVALLAFPVLARAGWAVHSALGRLDPRGVRCALRWTSGALAAILADSILATMLEFQALPGATMAWGLSALAAGVGVAAAIGLCRVRLALEETRAADVLPDAGFEVLPVGTPWAAHDAQAPHAAMPPPLPTAMPPWPAPREPISGAANSPRDLRTIAIVVAVAGLVMHVFRLPAIVVVLAEVAGPTPRGTLSFWDVLFQGDRSSRVPHIIQVAVVLAEVGWAMLALFWVTWGIVCLAAGPWFRRTAIVMALVTVGTCAAATFGTYQELERRGGLSRSWSGASPMIARERAWVMQRWDLGQEVGFAAVLITVLTRQGMRQRRRGY